MIVDYILIFVIGAIIGSFLNVCIYRIPRGLSIIRPSSYCPSCGKPIRFYDNIPIISYLILQGRCRLCKAKISFKYPLVEFLNALGYAVTLWKFNPLTSMFFAWPSLIVYLCFVSSLIIITFVDLEHQIIPDRITLPGIPLALLFGSTILPDPFLRSTFLGFKSSLIGLLLGGGLFYLVAVLSRGGMGGGDIKLMAMVGALLGWKGALFATFFGSLTGAIVGIYLMIFKGKGRKSKIPFGPFLAFGAILSLFFGQEILYLYRAI
ncbi:MAG TPA: prepilin peptidase [Nitrospiraceae bacterium]|nr:prepilin peptidase [Nitrospiraceae bacterium]